MNAVGTAAGSTAVRADTRHHSSDAVTSGAAFVGISIALLGGPGWESADDWAALLTAVPRVLDLLVHMERFEEETIASQTDASLER